MAAQPLTLFDNIEAILRLTPVDFPPTLGFYSNVARDNNPAPNSLNLSSTEQCYKIQKFIDLFNNEYLPKIKAKATIRKMEIGEEVGKGFIAPGLAYKADVANIKIGAYFKHFCDHDPLVYNHNGTTRINVIDRGTGSVGVGVAPLPQDIPAFIAYLTDPAASQPELIDALSYLWNPVDPDQVCYKYRMPSVLFTVNPGTNVLQIVNAPAPNATGPSREVNRFSAGGIVTQNTTNVFPGGKDDANLEVIGQLRGSNSVGFGNSTPLSTEKYNSYFTFPNFLLGEMLYMSPDPNGRPRPPATYVFRPFVDSSSQNDMEFWVKNYETGDASFPYDKKRYVLLEGWKMIERADGIIMYLSPKNVLHSDPPEGSYYIKKSDEDILRVIKSSSAYMAMVNAVNAAITAGGPYDAVQMGTSNVQDKLKLVAYMTNIAHLKTHGITTGGNKKKTKRKNIIKHVAKSKKKHNHK